MNCGIARRIEESIERIPMSGCWIWLGSLMRNGYAQISVDGRKEYVHRVSWSVHCGPIPEGLDVLHICDVRCCANPAHLFTGTNADNMADMVKKGRYVKGRIVKGEELHLSKLTEPEVIQIRRRSAQGDSNVSIANDFSVTPANVGNIVRLKTWAHVLEN